MATRKRSIQQIIEEQVKRWQIMQKKPEKQEERYNVVTISREPGSGGRLIATELAEKLGYDLFHQEVIHKMAESTQMSRMLLESLDEKGLSTLDDLISSIIYDRYLWPDKYLKHLMKVIGTIGKHGNAVIIGRGANFILSSERILKVRITAPLKQRILNVAKEFEGSEEEAKRRIIRSESNRRAFIRKYFNADISAPNNYDLVVNSNTLGIEASTRVIINTIKEG